MITRRAFAVGSVLLAACGKQAARCKNCGMKIDPASSWRADLIDGETLISFDTPRCAFTSWRSGKTHATDIRALDYYDRQWRKGAELKFVLGGDVIGPMGPDLVPVDPQRAPKFIEDHAADRAVATSEVTMDVLNSIK